MCDGEGVPVVKVKDSLPHGIDVGAAPKVSLGVEEVRDASVADAGKELIVQARIPKQVLGDIYLKRGSMKVWRN